MAQLGATRFIEKFKQGCQLRTAYCGLLRKGMALFDERAIEALGQQQYASGEASWADLTIDAQQFEAISRNKPTKSASSKAAGSASGDAAAEQLADSQNQNGR
jgi:hypothetical protein